MGRGEKQATIVKPGRRLRSRVETGQEKREREREERCVGCERVVSILCCGVTSPTNNKRIALEEVGVVEVVDEVEVESVELRC